MIRRVAQHGMEQPARLCLKIRRLFKFRLSYRAHVAIDDAVVHNFPRSSHQSRKALTLWCASLWQRAHRQTPLPRMCRSSGCACFVRIWCACIMPRTVQHLSHCQPARFLTWYRHALSAISLRRPRRPIGLSRVRFIRLALCWRVERFGLCLPNYSKAQNGFRH